MTLKESLQIGNNRTNIPVTVSWIYNYPKASKYMVLYNLPSSRGTMTRTLTLQVPKNRQHDTSLQSVDPNHQDYVSAFPFALQCYFQTGGSEGAKLPWGSQYAIGCSPAGIPNTKQPSFIVQSVLAPQLRHKASKTTYTFISTSTQ